MMARRGSPPAFSMVSVEVPRVRLGVGEGVASADGREPVGDAQRLAAGATECSSTLLVHTARRCPRACRGGRAPPRRPGTASSSRRDFRRSGRGNRRNSLSSSLRRRVAAAQRQAALDHRPRAGADHVPRPFHRHRRDAFAAASARSGLDQVRGRVGQRPVEIEDNGRRGRFGAMCARHRGDLAGSSPDGVNAAALKLVGYHSLTMPTQSCRRGVHPPPRAELTRRSAAQREIIERDDEAAPVFPFCGCPRWRVLGAAPRPWPGNSSSFRPRRPI